MANVADTKFDCDCDIYNGDGLYGEQTPMHRAVVKKAWPIIRNSLSSIPFTPGHGSFVICDYGTADGVNSLGLMTNCIDWVQNKYGEDQQVHVIYEDRPINDFNGLIRYIEGETAGSHSYLQDHKNIFVTCCGRSFYKQCLPDSSVHLGFSTTALSWFSDLPKVTSQEVFYFNFAEGSEEQRLFKEQAAKDWDNFLFYRSKELVPGGRLVVSTVGDTNCSCAKTRTNVWCWMMKMTDLWREMMHEKTISETIRLLQGLTQYLLCNLHALGRIAFLRLVFQRRETSKGERRYSTSSTVDWSTRWRWRPLTGALMLPNTS
ncbi:Methyltransferase FUS9 [Lamellibrachia satsuma]|nr:Methyltransferase FUS9 [Lamellibrachia satsuma]